ncbi:DUF5958 family protein [Chitinophaga sp.]|uniref:DUF5958 family protein n=1 Tax=Chitinophaga sp. TaxID=1869181 RepID=UPI0031E24930
MIIEYEILINKYGQGLINSEPLLLIFKGLEVVSKRSFLNDMLFLIQQSKPTVSDIEPAILGSGLKPTYTPCVLLKKGVATHNLEKLINLPENELNKVFLLLLSLFKVAYQRRFAIEKNHPNKWWYWDLSDEMNISKIP